MASKKIIELLAPAKNLICGRAAISHGADAIYIGGPKFGAREDACNSLQDIEKLVAEAQVFGVKVYVALNTILYDSELEDARQQIKNLYEIGIVSIRVTEKDCLFDSKYSIRRELFLFAQFCKFMFMASILCGIVRT